MKYIVIWLICPEFQNNGKCVAVFYDKPLDFLIQRSGNSVADQVEESEVYFTENVLLGHHLEPWCPKEGPARHFMELACWAF
jgi:hypothetical protein